MINWLKLELPKHAHHVGTDILVWWKGTAQKAHIDRSNGKWMIYVERVSGNHDTLSRLGYEMPYIVWFSMINPPTE